MKIKKQVKTYMILAAGLVFSTALVVFSPFSGRNYEVFAGGVNERESSVLKQEILTTESTPVEVHKIYNQGELLGVINDEKKLNDFLAQIYVENYQEDFPDSAVSLGKDIYVSDEMSYFTYEDIDDEIMTYLKQNGLFTIRAVSVEFSDTNGIYAEIFVKDEETYEAAMQEYLSCFIDPSELALLNSGQKTPELHTYGSRSTGISISQTITVQEAYAAPEEIMRTSDEVLEYLEYGGSTKKQYYTVQKYDTVAGVGAKNYGLSATQVMNINRDKISSVDQVLSEGEVLCVTYFSSPIDIVVTRESMRKEVIYPQTVYAENPELRKGVSELRQSGVNGSKNSLYSERWINGVLMSGTLISSVDTLQPVNEIIDVGTMEIPGYGTGTFRWPVDNPIISCGWGCYWGHRAIDVQNSYNHWDKVYAADRGIIEINSYNGVNGNYVVINHNNGFETYYGHMKEPSPLAVGTAVDKGDVIGNIGMTGLATGPHVHFFIIENGERRNPCNGFLDCGY